MKLKFNFSGKTLLRDWWKIVKDNFNTLEEEFNSHVSDFETAKKTLQDNINAEVSSRTSADTALGRRIDSETSARESTDTALGKRIDSEISVRTAADTALSRRIESEISSRTSADTTLTRSINSEISARESADTALDVRVTKVEEKAHTHCNNDLLDTITEDDVEKWNGIKTQVSAKELNEAVEYLEEIGFGMETQLTLLLNAAGVITYNGGWFGMEQNETALNGGELGAEQSRVVDCGDFSPLCITLAEEATVNGGEY